jgi:FtsP/CotA-like multicopper oxidase with cupredoxin domain
MPTFSRRSILKWTGIATAAFITPATGYAGYRWTQLDTTNAGSVQFEHTLSIPPLLDLAPDASGRVTPELALQAGRTELLPSTLTDTWGINGTYLGPTIRARRGDILAPRITNHLPEATTIHWHGMELPAIADGGPHQMIEPGATWSPVWTVDQPAATLWYHPHPHGVTKEHIYRGLGGLFYVEDGLATGLPHDYGEDDIPLIIQDKQFTDDDALSNDGIGFDLINSIGLLGSTILVNGTWGPVLEVTTGLVRLRILNASNARIYDLVFADQRAFHVVGSDSGLLPAPVMVDHVQISPGERFELVVSMTPGESVLLRSRPPDLGTMPLYGRVIGGDDQFDLLLLRAANSLRPSEPLPVQFPAPEPIAAGSSEAIHTFSLGTRSINGKKMKMDRIDFVVPLGAEQIWTVKNAQGIPHNFHIHNSMFQVLEIDGKAPPPELAGFKDTVYVPPLQSVRFAIRFGQYADPATPYMVHCHLLAHEDAGMMQQFVMVEPGTEDQVDRELSPGVHEHMDG